MTDLLSLAGVHTHVGRYHILQGIDFGVPDGRTTMLLDFAESVSEKLMQLKR